MIRRLATAVLVGSAALTAAIGWRAAKHTACPACGRFARLNIKDGDMLFLRLGPDTSQAETQHTVEAVTHALSHRGIEPSLIWVMTNDIEISALGVEEMRRAGWIPVPPSGLEMRSAARGLRRIERQLSG